jgi:hypothetical protein
MKTPYLFRISLLRLAAAVLQMRYIPTLHSLILLLIGAFFIAEIPSTGAQVLYTKFNGSTFQLRRVNVNGTGDTAVTTPFANLSFPAWSRDRALIALTATDPARPSQLTLNVFTFNPTTGKRQNVTNNQDSTQGGNYSFVSSYYKAFSPDRQRVAVNSVVSSGNENSSSNTPILQIYAADGSGGSLATVHVGLFRDSIHHDGEGISWSPTQNILAAPVKFDTPLVSGGGVGETTAIFLAEPVTNGGNARQLTFPHADQVVNVTQGYIYGEHDYQPKFSPNGASVAYVRSFQIAYTSNGGVPSLDAQSLHIINVNTGADTTVLTLQQGLYVTSLDWSPDGTALVFDAGQEYSTSGIPAQAVQPGTDKIYVVNTAGTGLRQLRDSGSGMPAWEPGLSSAIGSDFNRDGFTDYLLFNPSTRRTAMWDLQGNTFLAGSFGPTVPAGWVVGAVADLNLDSKPDYVLFNSSTHQTAVWFLNNNALIASTYGPPIPSGWTLIAAVDMNGDGRPDYVLSNPGTRQTAVWFLNNTTHTASAYGPTLASGWRLSDAIDFNHDGKRDFLLVNISTGRTAIWYLNGTTHANSAYGPTLASGWALQGAADFNNDSKPDCLLYQPSTRRTAIWYLNGATLIGTSYGPAVPAGYSLASP